jgi:hypothetical protein
VIDPFVNPFGMMEMYSSESAQGGILEATGTVAIKYRKKEQLATMLRLDPELQRLNAEKSKLVTEGGDVTSVEEAISVRSQKLAKVYHSIALRFCELHDTPGRMLEKKAVSKIVPWKTSRQFFGKRLLRRVLEVRLEKQHSNLYAGFKGDLEDDVAAIQHLQTLSDNGSTASAEVQTVSQLVNQGDEKAIADFLGALSEDAKKKLLEKLK